MRRLGQHFLKNRRKIKKIVGALELKDNDLVIEIGPGHGEITKEIKNQNSKIKIIAVEKDRKLAEILRKSIETGGNSIEITEGDALKLLPSLIQNSLFSAKGGSASGGKIQNYKIVGNIPYYITGRLFRVLGELKNKPEIIILTVQKEVAERVCAKPPKMNLLAASVQFWAEPKIMDFISKNDFYPPPKVNSAVIKLTLSRSDLDNIEIKNYYKLIKIFFKQPRKTILNNLKNGLRIKKDDLIRRILAANVNPEERPQNLPVEKIRKLAELLYN